MGEYATRKDNTQIKIGTCESMYYVRYEDFKNLRDITCGSNPEGLIFRLPFPDEDGIGIGEYEDYKRGLDLIDWQPEGLEPGLFQMTHSCGLLCNVTCHHGLKKPEDSQNVKFHWNGKTNVNFQLSGIKYVGKNQFRAVFDCKWCNRAWSTDEWDAILNHTLHIPKDGHLMINRLKAYVNKDCIEVVTNGDI